MKGGIGGLMKQAQMMQDNMKKLQSELGTMEVEGQAGSGKVRITMTCKHEVKRVSVAPELMGEDKDMLEDLLTLAFNDAAGKVEATVQQKMAGITAGMPLPPGMKFPF